MKLIFVLINSIVLLSTLTAGVSAADPCESYSPSVSDKYWCVMHPLFCCFPLLRLTVISVSPIAGLLSDIATSVAPSTDADSVYHHSSAFGVWSLDHWMEFLALRGHTPTPSAQVSVGTTSLSFSAHERLPSLFSTHYPLAAVPNCQDYTDCQGCAAQEECAWCASDNTCSTISDVFERDCRGLVFEPPCPTDFVPESVVVGNLVVRADATFGGGEVNISGNASSIGTHLL
jgi:hypothetical protein